METILKKLNDIKEIEFYRSIVDRPKNYNLLNSFSNSVSLLFFTDFTFFLLLSFTGYFIFSLLFSASLFIFFDFLSLNSFFAY